jgi:CRP/FNR family transcriptional regulator, dissimilatory nitrate respiration regulator
LIPVKNLWLYSPRPTAAPPRISITLHLLDEPGRIRRFTRKHAQLADRLPKKELALYLNLSPETLSRLKRRGKI